jgi:DNA-binding transcriptional LysR family regulator
MQQIRYFVALCETLNFTQAAERCNVSQPSLTRAIQALEAELGGELIRRERSLSHLTELGARMLPLMRQCYETAQAAKSLAASVKKGETAPLSIAVSRTVNLALLAPMLRELARAFPGLQLKLRRGSGTEIAELLRAGEVELAVAGPLAERWERIDTFPLFDERFELFVSREHRLSGHNAVDFAQLADERFLIHVECEMAEDVARRLRAGGALNGQTHEVTSDADLVALLEANLGVAVMPVSVARSDRVSRVPLNGLDVTRTVAVYGVAGRRRATAGATLLNLLRAADWSAWHTVGTA